MGYTAQGVNDRSARRPPAPRGSDCPGTVCGEVPRGATMVPMVTRLCVVLSVSSRGIAQRLRRWESGPKCIPGASAECYCPTGQQGAQTCTSAGAFAPCVCSGPPEATAKPPAEVSTPKPQEDRSALVQAALMAAKKVVTSKRECSSLDPDNISWRSISAAWGQLRQVRATDKGFAQAQKLAKQLESCRKKSRAECVRSEIAISTTLQGMESRPSSAATRLWRKLGSWFCAGSPTVILCEGEMAQWLRVGRESFSLSARA